mmetsp:Transcript_12167/g.23256  ORF Transcript_12167/g.23256 Transcript_12167/m.23256 type:complete len:414 (-) Transcript_12167:540-1781(-)
MDPTIDLSMPPVNIPMATAVPCPPPPPPASSSSPKMGHSTVNPNLVKGASWNDSPHLRNDQITQLQQEQGFPRGLAAELGRTRSVYPLRFWVIDNSGSMQTSDGHELRTHNSPGAAHTIHKVPCSRWKELQGSLEYHIQLAGLLEATTVFRFLNDPGSLVGPQEFSVGDTTATTTMEQQIEMARTVVQKASPRGVTPLTEHLQDIKGQIMNMETSLRERGQEAVVVLATDGLPSNAYGESSEAVLREFLYALKEIQSLPVWVVIRLCTDDEKVVSYYNSLDSELELPLEVIDDFFGEAAEIHQANKWLTYGLPLHRCREMGYNHRIFDLLDERLLNKDELVDFMKLLLGPTYEWADPHADWKEFCKQVQHATESEAKQFNPTTHKMEPWIDVKQLKKCYGSGRGGFRLFRKNK